MCASFIAVLMIVVFFSFPLAASAHTLTNNGRIYGQLQDGTKRNAPVVGQSVMLQMAQGQNARDLATVTTDAHGMFSFSGLNTDKTISYAVYTLYQKAQYVTDLISLDSKPTQQINLKVYDATDSAANIAIVQANILIDKADTQHGLLNVTESFVFENLGLSTYVGSLQSNGQKPDALRFSLPGGARQLSLKVGFDGYNVIQVDPGFASDAAIPPGTSQFAFSFQVPYSASHYDFSYIVVYPTVDLSVLTPLDYHASSAVLTSQGAVNVNQQTYQQLDAKQLLAEAQVHVELDGLPAPANKAGASQPNQNLPWFIAIVALMLAIVGVTWVLYIRMQRRTAARHKQAAKNATMHKTTSQRPTLAKADQETLLQQLLELDKAYEAGTIKKAEYQERRAKLKARLRVIMSAEAGEKKVTASSSKKAAGSGDKAKS
ncbi:MAG TPA: hypothetical protein VKR83_04525 [Ktedonobacteraceae bacterium]|nr:hypothetical protein [Ktedonobacteraceae bacterium]